MTSEAREAELRCAVGAARAAGGVLAGGFHDAEKGARAKRHRNDPVTAYDHEAQRAIVRILAVAHPEDGILSEESVASGGTSGRRWIVDPLDGTNNFLAGIPHFSVSIALVDGAGAVLGCVHDPLRDETFTAVRGGDARLDGDRISVSDRTGLDGAVLGVGLSYHPERRATILNQLPSLLARARVLRTLGSAALDLAYVAAGRFDATWYLSLDAWDVAAAALLVERAGGRTTDLRGEPCDDPRAGIVASNGRIHDALLHALAV